MRSNDWINYIPLKKQIPSFHENGHSPYPSPRADLSLLIKEISAKYVEEARSKNILLKFESPLSEAIVEGFPRDINQIMALLIRNAMTQTLEGFINIHLEEEAASFVIIVADSGLGVHPDQNMHISHTDFKGRPCRVMHIQDSSTKLSGIRDIVQNYGGQLDLQIEPGIGTTRKLSLPKQR